MIIVLYSFNFRSAPGTYSHRNISGRKEIIRATSYDHCVSSYKFNVWFCLGKRTRFLVPVVWQCFPWTQTPLQSCLKSKYVISQPDSSEYAQKIWSQRRDSIERLLAASGWMKPAGTSCNIPIGQNPPTWRGNDIVLARPWPDDLVQCRSSCAGGGISACCSTPHTAHRASYPGATSPSPRVSHRRSNGDGKPSTAKTAHCPI